MRCEQNNAPNIEGVLANNVNRNHMHGKERYFMSFKAVLIAILLFFSSLVLTSCSNGAQGAASSSVSSDTSSERKDNIDSAFMPDVESSGTVSAQSDEDVNANADAKTEALSDKKLGWGQGTQVDNKNRPVSCDSYNEKYGKYDAYFIGSDSAKKIYLTFDEGYENGYTEKILDVLKRKNAHAVFFVTKDYVKSNDKLIKRMISEGHVIGNHSWSHPSMPELTSEKAKQEITKLHDYVQKNFNYTMTLFRPPMGEFSEKSLAVTKQAGYKSVFWSFAYKDWVTDSQPDRNEALSKVIKCMHPGAIYLLHAVSKTNTKILSDFIDKARQEGYDVADFDL